MVATSRFALLACALTTAALPVFRTPASTPLSAQSRTAPPVVATGSGLGTLPAPKGPFFDITVHGAKAGGPAVANQRAVDAAITAAAAAGGGTVVVPAGTFKTFTIHLKSHVGLHLATPQSVLRAATSGTQEDGFYDAPEPNMFVGLQDHGHSHWANSLIYGVG
ncbi:MAG: hypothetical protein ABI051_07815, partial [Vicinamibacterales bacterium]